MNESGTYTVNDVIQILGISKSALYRLVERGGIPVLKIPGMAKVLFPKKEFDEWRRANTTGGEVDGG